MSDVLYSKLRLEVPSALNGENATITSEHGNSRVVQMSSPITDIMLAGMEKYRVQAGITDEDVLLGYGQIKKTEARFRQILKKLPYLSTGSSHVHNIDAIVLDDEIHILGGYKPYSYYKYHYKFNGTEWVSVSTLPYAFGDGAVVVLNGEIHILGGGLDSTLKNHYKWDGTNWVSVSTLPYEFENGRAVVLNGEIHIFGSSYMTGSYPNYRYPHGKKHYKWNGSSWSSVSTLPYTSDTSSVLIGGSFVVFNNQIHLLGGGRETAERKMHYKFNGSTWVSVSTLPNLAYVTSAVVFNGEIHLLGCIGDSENRHYKFNGSTWVSVSTLPYNFDGGDAVVWKNGYDTITILGTRESNYENYDAWWDGTSWTIGED